MSETEWLQLCARDPSSQSRVAFAKWLEERHDYRAAELLRQWASVRCALIASLNSLVRKTVPRPDMDAVNAHPLTRYAVASGVALLLHQRVVSGLTAHIQRDAIQRLTDMELSPFRTSAVVEEVWHADIRCEQAYHLAAIVQLLESVPMDIVTVLEHVRVLYSDNQDRFGVKVFTATEALQRMLVRLLRIKPSVTYALCSVVGVG
jgi:hypothetical protein